MKTAMHRLNRIWLLALGAAILIPTLAIAQIYPARPVRLIVPWPPGAPLDVMARALATELSQRWTQPVVVDNRAGAASIIGAEAVARAPADGYTWMATPINPTLVGNRFLYKVLPYDPDRSFAPISLLAQSSQIVVVHNSVPANSIRDLVALAHQQPGKLNYGSYGSGSQPHLLFELFKKREALDIVHVAYKGIAPLIAAAAAGEVQITAGSAGTVGELVKAGKLKALAVAGPERARELPNVPSAFEAGFPYLQASARFGLFAPAGTPQDVVRRINRDVVTVFGVPVFTEKYVNALGFQKVASTPEALATAIQEEVALVGEMVRAANVQPE